MSFAYRIALALLLITCAGCDRPAAKHENLVSDELRCIGIPREGASATDKIRACTALIEARPADKQDLASHHYWRGIWYSDLGQCEDATKDFDMALSLKPDHFTPSIYLERGRAFSCRKQYSKALENFDQAIALNPKFIAAFVQRGYAHIMLYEQDHAIEDGNRAIAAVRAGVDVDRIGDAAAHGMRGTAFAGKADFENALKDFDAAISLDSKNSGQFFFRRGFMQARLHHDGLAIADFDKAILLRADFVDALSRRGLAERKLHQDASADRDYRRATSVGSEGAKTLDQRCWIRAVWNRDLTLGLSECNRAQQLSRQEDREYLTTRCFIRLRMGDYDEAIRDCSERLASDPKDAYALYMRGIAKARAGAAGADRDLSAAKALLPAIAGNFADIDLEP